MNAKGTPPESPQDKLRKALEDLFFKPVHIDHQNVIPDGITITNDGKDYYINEICKLVASREAEARMNELQDIIDSITKVHGKSWEAGSITASALVARRNLIAALQEQQT